MNNRKLKIRAANVEVLVELDSSKTADNLLAALPATALANLWGDEIYFTLPIECCGTNMQEVVEKGAVAYWIPGKSVCLFFGPTPASQGDEIRPASAVHVFGRIVDDPTVLKSVRQGEKLTLERA